MLAVWATWCARSRSAVCVYACSVGHLVRKVSQARAEAVTKTLCERAITALPKGKNEQQRDMAVISLKTVVGEISGGNLAVSASNMIANKMLEGMAKVRRTEQE